MLDKERHSELEEMNLQIRAMSDEQIDKELSDYLENDNEKMILLLKVEAY